MIDIHLHIGKLYIGEGILTPSYLLDFMDKNSIERAALLPIESPEEAHYYITTNYIIDICSQYPDRFIPFCNVDPRIGNSDTSTDFYTLLKDYKDRGCKGFGEAMSGLYIDDPRMQKIYESCGKLKLPIVFHMDKLRNIDEIKLPRFEEMIKKFPGTDFVGHGMTFWSEVSADVDESTRGRYPKGKIVPPGRVQELLRKYPNIYGDISGGSGYNALTRDMDAGYIFLTEFQDKLMLGTDLCRMNQKIEIIDYLKEALGTKKISREVFEKITETNAKKVFDL